ncbi:hypothetical protein ACLOJK_013817 [Asimina triloba]
MKYSAVRDKDLTWYKSMKMKSEIDEQQHRRGWEVDDIWEEVAVLVRMGDGGQTKEELVSMMEQEVASMKEQEAAATRLYNSSG